jgi:hypothetical protein
MESSILSDLKRFAGPIKAKKLEEVGIIHEDPANAINIQKKTSAPVETANKVRAADSQITIDQIAAMVTEPLVPVRDANGLIHDKSTLVARCASGHLHKYGLKDIVDANSAGMKYNKCTTCSAGNKFSTMVRTLLEQTLGMPFILADVSLLSANASENTRVEFTNPILKINVVTFNKNKDLMGNPLADTSVRIEEYLLIKLHTTTSLKKLKESLWTHLSPLVKILPAETSAKINALQTVEQKEKKKRVYKAKAPLPFTPEHAGAVINAVGAPTNNKLNIVDGVAAGNETLTLENCIN